MKRGIFAFFLVAIFCDVYSQVYYINNKYLQTYEHVVRFERQKAFELINEEYNKQNNRNLLMFQLESTLYFIDAFLSETQQSRKRWTNRFPIWEKHFVSGNKQSPYYDYCIALLYFQKGLLCLKHMDYFQAGIDIRKAARLLDKNEVKFPDFFMQYKESGLLYCFIGNIPEQLEWLTGIAGIRGDMILGEKKLSRILDLSFNHKEFDFLQLDALLYSVTVSTVLYNNTDGLIELVPYLNRVKPAYRKSPVYIYISTLIFSHIGKNERAIREIEHYHSNVQEIRFDYLDYFHGVLLLQSGRGEAKKYFESFIRNFKGLHYIKSAYHKLAWCWLLEGNEQQYGLYMSMAKNSGKSATDADRQALNVAKSGKKPHHVLLKSRLLTDGGYYDLARAEMTLIDTSELCSEHIYCVEFYYRNARIHHLKSEIFQAIDLYKKVIELGSSDKEYFAANSALMLGTIYEELKDYKNAFRYYTLCLNLQFEEYRNSIQQKAKAGLQRIS